MNYAISVRNLGKSYNMYNKPEDRLKEFVTLNRRVYHRKFWALRNINFDIPKGRTIGIVGKNGSGKSTLLQLLCGTLSKTEGDLSINGRISALLELGTGFNPEFSGRQNVYLYCSLMGLSKQETDARIGDIENFAEIGDFIDQPVKTYSSGMYVRLAFAAAVNVEPDILIVDEALSVGDMYFQLKCINKIKEFKNQGKTILFVTHDTYTVKNICDYAIWINKGSVQLEGEVGFVMDEYENFMKKQIGQNSFSAEAQHSVSEVGEHEILRIQKVDFVDNDNRHKEDFVIGEDVTVVIEYELFQSIQNIVGGVAIFDSTGHYVCGLNTKLDGVAIENGVGKHRLVLVYPEINLLPGTYFIDVGFFEDTAVARLDYKAKVAYFNVTSKDYLGEGNVLLKHRWRCE